MTIYKPGTRVPWTEEDYVEMAAARISRIVSRQGPGRVFLTHEVLEVLKELVKEIKESRPKQRDVLNTPLTNPGDVL